MAGHCRKMLYGIEKKYKQTAKRVGIHATLVLTAPVGSKTGEYSDHVFCPSTFFLHPNPATVKKRPKHYKCNQFEGSEESFYFHNNCNVFERS